MKMKRKTVLLAMTLAATVALSGCGAKVKETSTTIETTTQAGEEIHTISFVTNGGTAVEPIQVQYQGIYTLPTVTRENYTFAGWYTDEALTNAFIKGAMPNHDLILYANWDADTYGIHYELDGGKLTNKKTHYAFDEELILEAPTKTGCSFDGWYLDSDFKTPITKIDKGSTGDKTIYAKWSIASYTITYELDGGSLEGAKESFTINDEISLGTPAKAGCEFIGWFSDKECTTMITKINKGTIGDQTIYAKWKYISYTITYNLNDGELEDKRKSYTAFDEVELGIPTREGYDFVGWYTDAIFEKPIEKIEKGTFGNITLYAKWRPTTYTITYNLNGGSITDEALGYTILDEIELVTPIRDGYTFDGWYRDDEFNSSISKIEKGSIGELDVFAKWTPITYTITYNLDGGVLENPKESYTTEESFLLPTPTKEYFEFVGWYSDSEFQNPISKIEEGTLGNQSYYAKWEPISFTITYDLDDGVFQEEVKTTYTILDTYTLPTPTSGTDKFLGWYLDSDYTKKVTSIETGTTGNQTYYAKWEAAEYTVIYHMGSEYCHNGASEFTGKEVYAYFSSRRGVPTLMEPTRDGYFFDGWFTNDSYTMPVESIERYTYNDVEVYAKWTCWIETKDNSVTGLVFTEMKKRMYFDIVFPTKDGNQVNTLDTITKTAMEGMLDCITSITLPNTYTTIEMNAFIGAIDLKTITLTSSIKSIGDNAFSGCSSLEAIYFDGTMEEWNSISFGANWDSSTKDYSVICNDGTLHKLVYELDGGELENPTYYYDDSIDTMLPTPIKEAYTFLGWYTDDTFENKVEQIEKGQTSKITLYAKWTLTEYTITYMLDGGTLPEDIKTTFTKEDSFKLPTPSCDPDTFLGWYLDAEFTEEATELELNTKENITFYAKWEYKQYTLTYVMNSPYWQLNGSDHDEASKQKSFYSRYGLTSLMEPSMKNAYFDGWYTSESYLDSEKVTSVSERTKGDVTLYAKWSIWAETENDTLTKINYQVLKAHNETEITLITLSTDGKTTLTTIGENAFKDASSIESVTIPATYTTIEANAFSGCSSLKVIYFKSSIQNIETNVLNGCTSLERIDYNETSDQWRTVTRAYGWDSNAKAFTISCTDVNIYKINYYLDGGSVSSELVPYATIYTCFTLPTPTKLGYAFKGWYTDKEFKNSIVDIEKYSVTEPFNLYVKWEIITYTISYKNTYDEVVSFAELPKSYTVEDEIDFTGISIDGYRIYEFRDKYSLSVMLKIYKGNTGNLDITIAIYKLHTLYFDQTGDSRIDNVIFDESMTITDFPTPKWNGFTFLGWSDYPAGRDWITVIPEKTMDDVFLYAQWEVNKYTINFQSVGVTYKSDVDYNNSKYYAKSDDNLKDAIKPGYAFLCWSLYDKPDDNGNYIPFDYQMPDSLNFTLYACFEKLYETSGGKILGINKNLIYPSGKLKEISIPSSIDGVTITTIAEDALKNLEITKVNIDKSITRICANAFENCSRLSEITYNGTVNDWNSTLNKELNWDLNTGDYRVYIYGGDNELDAIMDGQGNYYCQVIIRYAWDTGYQMYIGAHKWDSDINVPDLAEWKYALSYYNVNDSGTKFTDPVYRVPSTQKLVLVIEEQD